MQDGAQPTERYITEGQLTEGLIRQFRAIVDSWDGQTDGRYTAINRADVAHIGDVRGLPRTFAISPNSIDAVVIRDVAAWVREHHVPGAPQMVSLDAFTHTQQPDGSYAITPPPQLMNRIAQDILSRARAVAVG